MKLQDLNSDSFLYLDRYVNDKSYSRFSNFSAVAKKYRPESSTKSFKVPYYLLDPSEVKLTVASTIVDKRHLGLVERNGKVIFYIHPDVLSRPGHTQWDDPFLQRLVKTSPGGYVMAAPTSSTRTVFIPKSNLYLKLHIPKRISRFQRRIHEPYIQHNIEIVEEIISCVDSDYNLLPDVIGVSQLLSEWGYIVRDAAPYNSISQNSIIPGFSLYGKDSNHTDDLPLVVQMLKSTGQDPVEFISDMTKKVISGWWQAYVKTGAIQDLHGQNVLFEISNNKIIHPIFRDYYALTLDNSQRQKIGLQPVASPMNSGNQDIIKRIFSNTYDYHFGHHFLDFLADCLKKYFQGLDENILKHAVAQAVRPVIDVDKFPLTVYRYKNKTFTDGGEELVDTGKLPVWR